MTPNQASAYSAITWFLASIVFIPTIFWYREQASYTGQVICTVVFPKTEKPNFYLYLMLILTLFTCLVPMMALVYNYSKIFQKIISTKNTWASSCVVLSTVEMKGNNNRAQARRQSELSLSDIFSPWPRKCSSGSQFSNSNGRQGSMSQHEELRLNRHIKVIRVLFLNVLMVLIMWLPITIMLFLVVIDNRRSADDTNFFLHSHHFIATLMVAFLNTVVNPVLYGVLSDNFRSSFDRLCCSKNSQDLNIAKETITPSSGRTQGIYKAPRKQSYINSVSESPNEVV